MKILWISHIVPYPPKAGMLMRCYYLVSELGKESSLNLLCLNQSGLLKQHFGSDRKGLAEAEKALCKDVKVFKSFEFDTGKTKIEKILLALKCLFLKTPYSVLWLKSKSLKNALVHEISENEYDLIHIDTVGLAQYLPIVKEANLPIVLDHHNIESHMMLRRAEKTRNLLKKLYFYLEGVKLRSYEKSILNVFDMHITCSDLDGERLKRLSSDINVTTIPNPVDVNILPEVDCKKEIQPFTLLFIGGLNWYPNVDAIIHFCTDILPQLLNLFPNIKLDIVGRSPSKEILAFQKKYSNITVHGFVDSISEFYQKSQLYICPIRDGGGTKLKVIDAMANRKLVIGYKEAFEGLDVTHGKDCLIAKDSEDFIQLISDSFDNNSFILEAGMHAQNLVLNKYDRKAVGRNLIDLYRSLIEKGKSNKIVA